MTAMTARKTTTLTSRAPIASVADAARYQLIVDIPICANDVCYRQYELIRRRGQVAEFKTKNDADAYRRWLGFTGWHISIVKAQ